MPADLTNLYWLLLGAALLFACVSTVAANAVRTPGWTVSILVPVSLVLLVAAGRWPTLNIPIPLNPDESLMLAQAIKFQEDWVPWRAIDPGTGGPINSYVLLVLHGFGMPIDYPLARATGTLCIAIHLVLMFVAMTRLGGAGSAAVACLPAAAFFALATDADLTHYSSELASLMMISLMALLISRLTPDAARIQAGRAFAIGLSAFLVCMSKVQGVPLAALLAMGLLAVVSADWKTFGFRTLYIILGGATGVCLLLAVLAWTGVLGDFNISFLQLPFQYAAAPLDRNGLNTLLMMLDETSMFGEAFLWLLALAALLYPLHARFRHEPWRALLRLGAALLVTASLYVVLTSPGRFFPHYTAYLGLALPWIGFYLLPWHRTPGADPSGAAR